MKHLRNNAPESSIYAPEGTVPDLCRTILLLNALILMGVVMLLTGSNVQHKQLAQKIETEQLKESTYYVDLCEAVDITENEIIFCSNANGNYFVWDLEENEKYSPLVKGKRFTVWFDGRATETRIDDVILDFEIVQ